MKFKVKTFLWSLLAIVIIIASLGGLLYWQRNHIIEYIAKDKLAKIEQDRDVKISFSKMKLVGLDELVIESFKIQEQQDPAFLTIGNLDCELSLWGMLRRKVVFTDMKVNDIYLNIINENGERNYDFLFHTKTKNTESATKEKKTIYEQISDKLNKVFDIVPEDLSIKNMHVNMVHNNYRANVYLPELNVVDNEFSSLADIICKGSAAQKLSLQGNFANSNHTIKCDIASATGGKIQIPLIDSLFHAIVRSDSLHFSFETSEEEDDHIQLSGTLGFSQLNINYERLSDRDLEFGNGALNYVLNIKDNVVELDSASTVVFNKLNFHPYVKVELKPSIKLTTSINKETFPSSELFSSIPNGLFVNLDSIQTAGDLDYHFYLQVDKDNIDSLKFYSALNKHSNFRIIKFGKTDFRRINEPFEYEARDHGELVRTFEIGNNWNHFRPLDSISPYLQAAVMISEDGYFYTHKGFYDGAIQYSLIQNLKQGRFARGGSTISMQLVKNVFLNNNKNIMRKLEEIMIVWLIENERLVSKKRMYEIYLNIVEWGPNHQVYGAEEAAQFYFRKHAHQLTPEESIFLATIIPSPKKFMYRFDETHHLRHSMDYYIKLVGGKMLTRGYIDNEQYNSLSKYNVVVTGPAVNWLPKLKIEPTVADSVLESEGSSIIDLDE